MKDEIQEKIDLVTNDIVTRHPGCSYTVTIKLWDDDTFMVECRHGTIDMLYVSYYYNNELSYYEVNTIEYGNVMVDKYGNEYFQLLKK